MTGTFIPDFSITDVSPDGRAFGMHKEMKVFVDKGIPGDIADIAMIKSWRDNKMTGNGKIISLKKKSSLRIDPFCKHFKYCGGCQWQNISYEDQLKLKQRQVEETLKLFNQNSNTQFNPILPSSQQKYFRNRVTFTFSNRRWMSPEELADISVLKQPAGGYALRGKNDRVMNIEECFLTDDFAIKLMHSLRDEALGRGYSFYDVRYEKGFLRGLTIRFGDASNIMAIVVFGEDDKEKISVTIDYLVKNFPQITSLYYVIHKRKRGTLSGKDHVHASGNSCIEFKMEDLLFRTGPQSFFQTNTKQALALYRIARDFAQLTGTETVYDLYTGTGTIALFVAQQAQQVVGVDSVPEAIEDAKQNAILNKVTNTSFFVADLYGSVNRLKELFLQSSPDVIITDPPRAGMDRGTIRQLLESNAKRIIYISCNPSTQARDIRQLSEGYSFVRSQPVDMFPLTSHVENVALLERNQP